MASTYTGSDASFPSTITIPDDADAEDVASVNVPLEALADQTAWLKTNAPRIGSVYTASAAPVVPAYVTKMIFEGVGGGGGGGGGASSITASGNTGSYGASGGGARRGRVVATVVPGETLTIAVGAGGTAGTAGASGPNAGGNGGHGGDTTVTGSTSGLLATFRGAQGGMGGDADPTKATYGGLPAKPIVGDSTQYGPTGSTVVPPFSGPGVGGSTGTSSTFSRLIRNGGSTAYAEGGAAGAAGTGGGASEWPGGTGAAGPTVTTTGSVGNAGNAGALGSGGSGGGGGNNGLVAFSQAGAAGGAGGNGVCAIVWMSP